MEDKPSAVDPLTLLETEIKRYQLALTAQQKSADRSPPELKSALAKLKEMQRDLLNQSKHLNVRPDDSIPPVEKLAFPNLEVKAAQAAVKAAQESAAYWEAQFKAKFQDTSEGRAVEKAVELTKKQFAAEIELLKAGTAGAEAEKSRLREIIENLKAEHKKVERENLSATYSKVRELENEIQALYKAESEDGRFQTEALKMQAEQELESRTRHYRHLLAEKDAELAALRTSSKETSKTSHEMVELKKQLEAAREENTVYTKQITALKKELAAQESFFAKEHEKVQKQYEKEVDSVRAEAKKLAQIVESTKGKLSKPETRLGEGEMLEAAKEKIGVLEEELRLQERHFGRTIVEKDQLVSELKEKLADAMKETESLKRVIHKLEYEVNETRSKLARDTYEKKSKDMKIAELSQRASRVHVTETTEAETGDKKQQKQQQKSVMSLGEIMGTWKRFYDDDNIRCDLLMRVIQSPELKAECVSQSLQQYLLMLYQAFTSDKPILYEAATISLNELIALKKIEPAEFKALCSEFKVIKSLVPQREEETEAAAVTRHSAAIGVLCYMDNINIEWTPSMTEQLIETNGMGTIKFYIQNYTEFEGVAVTAAQVSAYLASFCENLVLFKQDGFYAEIINAICTAKSTELKRNSAECLAILIKDAEIRALLEEDERVGKLVAELLGASDAIYRENLLLCFVNLTVGKVFKKLLFDEGIVEGVLAVFLLPDKEEHAIALLYALKIVYNLSYPGCAAELFPKVVSHLGKSLATSTNPETVIQGLITVQKLLEDDSGKHLTDYGKLLSPIISHMKSTDDSVVAQALKTFDGLCKVSGSQFLNEANIKGDIIKLTVLYYCTTESPVIGVLSQKLLTKYAANGYVKDIGTAGKIGLLEKTFKNVQDENVETRGNAFELLGHLAAEPSSREKILGITGIEDWLAKFIDIVTVPTPLDPDEAKEIESVTRILGELAGSSAGFDEMVSRENMLKAFVNVMHVEGYPRTAKIYAVKGVSNMCGRKGNKEVLGILLKIPGGRFLESLVDILSYKDEIVYKCAIPLCELMEIEARQGNPLFAGAIKKTPEILHELAELAKSARGSKTGIGKLLAGTVAGLAASDPQIEGLLRADGG